MNVGPVRRVLDRLGARYALIGAHAMAARGYPRFTVDVDLLTTDSRVLDQRIWSDIANGGATVEVRRGDEEDPLGGVVHILLEDGTDIDVMVPRWKWEAGVIERAETLTVAEGVTIGVPLLSDLILLKLAAGGYTDRTDAAALFAIGDRETVVREVESRIEDVRPDVRSLWQELLRMR